MEEKEHIERVFKSLDFSEVRELINKSNKSKKHFDKHYGELVKKHAGKIVAVSDTGKIVAVPFTDDISKAKENLKILERGIGKENMSGACVSYIPRPNQKLLL